MAKEKTWRQRQGAGTPQSPPTAGTTKNGYTGPATTGASGSRKFSRSGGKGNQSQIGGTAVPGAKSTLPKQVSNSNNPQQQERESSNRTMRRRMDHLGTGLQAQEQVKVPRNRRKERIERIKERQKAQVSAVKRSLPGGKLVTNVNRVYYLIGGISAFIVLLIVVFVVLRATGVLQ